MKAHFLKIKRMFFLPPVFLVENLTWGRFIGKSLYPLRRTHNSWDRKNLTASSHHVFLVFFGNQRLISPDHKALFLGGYVWGGG